MYKQLNAHFFFAMKLPVETKKKLKEYCGNLSPKLPFSRWVHQEDYHITLAFLGSAPQEKLQKAAKLAADSIRHEKDFLCISANLAYLENKTHQEFSGVEPSRTNISKI